jgi:hypothetical protein
MKDSQTRIRVLSGLGLMLAGASCGAGDVCSLEAPSAGAVVVPVDHCPEDICETGKFPRFRTFLRRMSWKHNTSHSHFMYESCPPYWQPAFGYYETGWRRGEALPPQCPGACPPPVVPVCPDPSVFDQIPIEPPVVPKPLEDVDARLPPVSPPPEVTPAPTPAPPPEQKSIPATKPASSARTPSAVLPARPVATETRRVPSPVIESPQPATPAAVRHPRPSAFSRALAGAVTTHVFPDSGVQADAFPVALLPAKPESSPLTKVSHVADAAAFEQVERLDHEEQEFRPIQVLEGCPLRMAVTTGEFVIKSASRLPVAD